jgi:hypothetical protein
MAKVIDTDSNCATRAASGDKQRDLDKHYAVGRRQKDKKTLRWTNENYKSDLISE